MFDFTRKLSLRQLQAVASMHDTDSARRPGTGSYNACSPFFLKRDPHQLSGTFDNVYTQYTNELAGIV